MKQKGFVAANDSSIDAKTKLPTRIVHRASGIIFVLILPGEFIMGSPDTEAGRETDENQHRRGIKEAFYIGETKVTVEQFRRFVTATKYILFPKDYRRFIYEVSKVGKNALLCADLSVFFTND